MQLKYALSTSHTVTCITNRRNGLEEEVTQLFEGSYHGYCMHHLEKDFKAQLEQAELTPKVRDAITVGLRSCVYACKADEFNECVESIKTESKELAEWVLSA